MAKMDHRWNSLIQTGPGMSMRTATMLYRFQLKVVREYVSDSEHEEKNKADFIPRRLLGTHFIYAVVKK
jgi:hypothetical protein